MEHYKDNQNQDNTSFTTGLSRKKTYQKVKMKPKLSRKRWSLIVVLLTAIVLSIYFRDPLFQIVKNTVVEKVDVTQKETKLATTENKGENNETRDKAIKQQEKTTTASETTTTTITQTNNPNYDLTIIKKQETDALPKPENGEIILLGENDLTFKGINENKEFFFTLPPSEMGDGSYLELTVSSSQLLNKQFSSFTIYVNDEPIKSMKLDKVMEFTTFRVPLQKRLLIEGLNKVSIKSHTFINQDICLDQNDPANWMIVHNTSYMFIDKRNVVINEDLLKNFPYPFVTEGQEEMVTTIIIPKDSKGALVKEAMEISKYLSSQNSKRQPVSVKFENEWEAKDDGHHIIAIGPLKSWTGKLANWLSTSEVSLQDQELYLKNIVDDSKGKNRHLLFVTAKRVETIIEKGYILTTPKLTEQLTGNSIKILHSPKVISDKVDKSQTDLKLFDQPVVLDDATLLSQRYFVNIPSFWSIKDKGTLHLKFQASLLLEQWTDKKSQDKIGLTAYINDIPYTIPLATLFDESDTEKVLEYKIPIDQELLANNSFLSVVFELHYPGAEEGCVRNTKSGNWVVINKDSGIIVPYTVESHSSFKNWPSALMGNEGFEKTAFILPMNIPSNGLNQLSTLINHLSSFQTSFDDFIVVRSGLDTVSKELLTDYHLIDFGELKHTLNEEQQLKIPWSASKGFQLSEYGFISETAKYLTWTQPSFWNADKSIVFFEALEEDKNHPFYHQKFFSGLEKLDKKSNPSVIVLNKANEAFAFSEDQKKDSPKQGDSKQKSTILYFLVFGLIFLLAVIVFLYILRKRGSKFS
jgi:cellulose synthase operon protein B